MDEKTVEQFWAQIHAGTDKLLSSQSGEGLNKAHQLARQRVGFIAQHMTPIEALALALAYEELPGMHEGLAALNQMSANKAETGFLALQSLMFIGILTLCVAEVRLEEQIEKVTEGQKELPN